MDYGKELRGEKALKLGFGIKCVGSGALEVVEADGVVERIRKRWSGGLVFDSFGGRGVESVIPVPSVVEGVIVLGDVVSLGDGVKVEAFGEAGGGERQREPG